MSNSTKPYETISLRDGLSQQRRKQTVLLKKDFVLPDERTLDDLVAFAKNYAKNINFFDLTNTATAKWTDLFDYPIDTKTIKEAIEKGTNFEPHYALYLAFIQLFQTAQNQLNGITKRHLDFYYEQVLNLKKLDGQPDDVHVVFELAKNISNQEIAKKTLLDAGKNDAGKSLQYAVTDDVIINNAVVSNLCSVYLPPAEKGVIRIANIANSADGIGAELDKNAPYWQAFGNNNLPATKIGFSLASAVLLMKEGNREITVTLNLSSVATDLKTISSITGETLEIFYTGEKAWMGPFNAAISYGNFVNNTQQIIIKHTLTNDDGAIVLFDTKLHTGNYITEWPVMQLLANTTAAGNIFGALKNAVVANTKIAVKVTGVKSISLENDFGVLDNKKPFMPFGPQPKVGASFYVSYDEVLNKKIDTFSFDVNWQAAPASFNTYYSLYTFGSFSNPVSSNAYFTAKYFTRNDLSGKQTNLFNLSNAQAQVSWPDNSTPVSRLPRAGVYSLSSYRSYQSLMYNPNFGTAFLLPYFDYNSISKIGIGKTALPLDKGFVRFELQKDFLHNKYPGIYAMKMKEETTKDPNLLPNEPYTPTIKNIVFNYEASTSDVNIASNAFSNFNLKEVQYFHNDVFGIAEQHGYLKQQTADSFGNQISFDKSVYLFPQHNAEGNLLIGLSNATADSSVSFLFQLAEGSANPEKEARTINWYALCNNEWRPVLKSEILKDETNHLLQSGIIRMVLPKLFRSGNTILDSTFMWLKAEIVSDTDAVCKFNRVIAQACKAAFVVTEDIHPSNNLADNTITKLVVKKVEVKSLSQPFNSFGGTIKETEDEFYVRISERLRHKQRSVSAWDYEHIILQQFNEVYKVKCLNHAALEDGNCCADLKPGNVTLIVVPDVRNKNMFNPLEPKVSLNTITNIEAYLKTRTTFFVSPQVQNPEYEKVQLEFKVKFSTIGDFGIYSAKLNQAILEYLTPWAYSNAAEIEFGGTVRKSVLINFIEEQSYVDFLTDVKMYHIDKDGNKTDGGYEINIKNPRAILVSDKNHIINEFTDKDICK